MIGALFIYFSESVLNAYGWMCDVLLKISYFELVSGVAIR